MSRTGAAVLRVTVFFLPVLLACANTAMQRLDDDPGARTHLETLTAEEHADVSRGVEELRLMDEVWAPSELEYYSHWLDGLEAEQSGDLDDAILSYRIATLVQRYEMDNFAVLLPLGRVLMRDGQAGEARRILTEYVRRARTDLVAEGPWEYSEEGVAEVEETITFAEWLLGYLGEE
jgi:hypothetical protein